MGRFVFFPVGVAAFLVALILLTNPVHAEKTLRYQEGVIRSWIEGNLSDVFERPAVYPTENFAIYYLESQFGADGEVPDYIERLHTELEYSRQAYIDLGFEEPVNGRTELLTVIVTDPSAIPEAYGETGELYVGEIWKPGVAGGLGPGSYILLRNNLAREHIQFTVAHEVFHLFQNAPAVLDGYGARRFILEQTAVWAANTVLTGVHPDQGYTGRLQPLWQYWGRGHTPLVGQAPYDKTGRNIALWYGSGAFLLWLDAQTGDGASLVRDLIGAPLRSDSIAKAWWESVARHVPNGDVPTALLQAGLALWLVNGPDPYRLPRGQAFLDYVTQLTDEHQTRIGEGAPVAFLDGDRVPFEDEYLGTFDAQTGLITPVPQRIEAMASRTLDFEATSIEDLNADYPLFISFQPENPDMIRVGIVETSPRFDDPGQRVTELTPYPGQAGGSFIVPRFGAADLGFTESVWLMSVNGDWLRPPGEEDNFSLTVNIGGPPILQGVEVQADGGTIYQAQWVTPEEEDAVLSLETYAAILREREVETNGLTATQRRTDSLSNIGVTLRFSKPVWLKSLTLDGTEFFVDPVTEDYRTEWFVEAYHTTVSWEAREAGHMVLSVEAIDQTGASLDGDPTTRAALSVRGDKWIGWEDENQEGFLGGVDRSHKIRIGSDIAYLEAVRLRTENGGYYHQEWTQETGAEGRTLSGPDSVPFDPTDTDAVYLLELQFNTRLGDGMQVLLGGVPISMRPLGTSGGYYAELSARELAPALTGDPAPLVVTAMDREGRSIDSDPATIADEIEEKTIGTQVEGWEPGPDNLHLIPVEEGSLQVLQPIPFSAPLGQPFFLYQLFDFEDALDIAPGVSVFRVYSDQDVYPNEADPQRREARWGPEPPDFLHPELWLDPRDLESDVVLGSYGHWSHDGQTWISGPLSGGSHCASADYRWSAWPSSGTLSRWDDAIEVRLNICRFTHDPGLFLRAFNARMDKGFRDGSGLAPGFDAAIMTPEYDENWDGSVGALKLDQASSWTETSVGELTAVLKRWRVKITAVGGGGGVPSAEAVVQGMLGRIAARLRGEAPSGGQRGMPDAPAVSARDFIQAAEELTDYRNTMPDNPSTRWWIERMESNLGVTHGRMARLKEWMGEERWPLYPAVEDALQAAQVHQIPILPEPPIPVASPELMSPDLHDHSSEAKDQTGFNIPAPLSPEDLAIPPSVLPIPEPPGSPAGTPADMEAALIEGFVEAFAPSGPGAMLVIAFTRQSGLWDRFTDEQRRELVEDYFQSPLEEQLSAPLFFRSLMMSARADQSE